MREYEDVKWDLIGLGEVGMISAVFIILLERYTLCNKSLVDKKEQAAGFLTNKNPTRNVDEFFSIIERVARISIKLDRDSLSPHIKLQRRTNRKFSIKIIKTALRRHKAQCSTVKGHFTARVGTRNVGKSSSHFGVEKNK